MVGMMGPAVSGERLAEETVFYVKDNGRGIAEADMDKVFTPFRRAGRQDVSFPGFQIFSFPGCLSPAPPGYP